MALVRNLTGIVLLSAFLVAGCATGNLPNRPNEREWRKISTEYDRLVAMRRSLPEPAKEGSRKEQIEVLLANHKKLEPLWGPFLEDVREYYERTGDSRAAALYADEKVRMGDEYMDVLARYDRAIELYRNALAIDPSNERAKERLEVARSERFVSMDAFARIREGMKAADVRQIVGMPREDWIRQIVQNERVFSVWIYPKADGGASAIYFENDVVYHTNWNAAAPAAAKDDGATRAPGKG
ncbi:MAG: hypothetical protein WBX15_03680 [Thermoanaerobaculia bacterium]